MKPDVWIPQRTAPEHRALLTPFARVRVIPSGVALQRLQGHADMLVVGNVGQAFEAAARLDGLRVMQTLSAGVDGLVDRVPPGITLCDASGVHDVAVAEWVVMAILAARRDLAADLEAQSRATWRHVPADRFGEDLDGATVVIVGYGSIGRAVEARLAGFGARIVRVARRPRDGVMTVADLPRLLPDADIVLLTVPLTAETRGLVDAAFLARMRRGSLLVNAARGALVDTDALVGALTSGHIRAALDVTDPEPLPPEHLLWSAPGVLITPHIGSAVRKIGDRAWRFVARQVERYARGEPLENVVVDGY
jgi:phosphoglycerate dehydrogenase-like enzyme